jgi:hypothetical protein
MSFLSTKILPRTMSSKSEEMDTRKAVRELERAIICFLEDYADVFPDMNINDGIVEIPVSSAAVWKLTMKIKTKKNSSE